MKCDHCGGEMVSGFALDGPFEGSLGMPHVANADTIEFIDVMKCGDCGRSLTDEEIKDRLRYG